MKIDIFTNILLLTFFLKDPVYLKKTFFFQEVFPNGGCGPQTPPPVPTGMVVEMLFGKILFEHAGTLQGTSLQQYICDSLLCYYL